jgi:hypothetical protein
MELVDSEIRLAKGSNLRLHWSPPDAQRPAPPLQPPPLRRRGWGPLEAAAHHGPLVSRNEYLQKEVRHPLLI